MINKEKTIWNITSKEKRSKKHNVTNQTTGQRSRSQNTRNDQQQQQHNGHKWMALSAKKGLDWKSYIHHC